MEARLDVIQEHLYVGLDLHKRRWISTVRTRDLFLKRMASPADKELFVQSLRRQWPQAKFSVVYEAGCFGYHIADYLRTQDIEPIIVAPHRVPVMPGDRIKTDAIDSNKLAEALAAGTLKSIHQRPAPVLYDRGVQTSSVDQAPCPNPTAVESRSLVLWLRASITRLNTLV
jgi:hypothetical protein